MFRKIIGGSFMPSSSFRLSDAVILSPDPVFTSRFTGTDAFSASCHILPKGYRKIRMFGFLANRYKMRNLEAIRKYLKIIPAKIVKTVKKVHEKRSYAKGFG